jgi:phospholipid/cholesterol/gamma-HCH transport system ATP-binding protein
MNTVQPETLSNASHGMTNGKPVIEISNLKKSLDGQEVLKNISLQLFSGENLVVLGRSGSGKSVLIKCIIRLMDHDDGKISVLGEDVSALNSAGLGELRAARCTIP